MIRSEAQFHNARLFMYVVVAIVMSGYDAVATMQHIGRGVAAEGNPIMDSLIQRNAVVFFLVKMAITALCLLVCYNYSHLKIGRLGVRLAVAVYSIICFYHMMIVLFH